MFEYQWPLNDKSAEWFLLQEHISEFLGVVSFKRKYPGTSELMYTIYNGLVSSVVYVHEPSI